MQWLRLYDDLLDDPKAQQLRPELFKYWINLLCLANKGTPRGTLPDLQAIAFRLRVNDVKARTIVADLKAVGLLDEGETLRPHNWEDRQKRSDSSADRVAKHRKGVTGNGDVTLQASLPKRDGNALDIDTDTDTDTEEKLRFSPPNPLPGEPPKAFDLLSAMCSAIGADPSVLSERDKGKQLAAAKRLIEGGATTEEIRQIARWLSGQSWLTGGVDLLLVEKQIGKWRLNGRPQGAPPLPPLPDGVTAAQVQEWTARKHANYAITDEQAAILASLNGVPV